MLSALLLCGVVLSARGASGCENRTLTLDKCLEQLPPLLENTGNGLPSSRAELLVSCSAFKTGMKCVEEYSRCLGERQRKIVVQQVQGAQSTFRFLCDDATFQAEYLQYTDCYKAISRNYSSCSERFLSLVKDSQMTAKGHQQVTEQCCAKYGFLQCIYAAGKRLCTRKEANFLKMIADSLSSLQVHSSVCRELGTEVCRGANLTLSPLGLLLAALVLLGP